MVEPTQHRAPSEPFADLYDGTLDSVPPFPEGDDVGPPQGSGAPSQPPWYLVVMLTLLAVTLLLAAIALA